MVYVEYQSDKKKLVNCLPEPELLPAPTQLESQATRSAVVLLHAIGNKDIR